MDLSVYTAEHASELKRLLGSHEWQRVIRSGLVEDVKANKLKPGNTRPFIDTVVNQLLSFNEGRVKELVSRSKVDDDEMLDELSKWPEDLGGKEPEISFLGLNVTPECNFKPKCIYCNQPYVEPKVDISGWKRIIAECTSNCNGAGPYIYITGGEPLVLGEQVWGDEGLIRFATERGAGVNVNTNATLITPEVALHFIKSGLLRLHISLDTPDRDVQNMLFGGDRFDQVLRGIYNVQIARDLVGVSYPVIHTNCVLTKINFDHFPDLFAFVLEKHKQTGDRNDPFFNDLFMHVIPVGGQSNKHIRPSEDEFRRFYTEIWDRVCKMWDEYQEKMGVPSDKRGVLFGYFSNPFLRVRHEGGLDAYVKASAEGVYGKLALSKHCYVAPTQAAFTPDGNQYRCGAHAIRHTLPIGNIDQRGVFASIKEAIKMDVKLPDLQHCSGCALATLYINQAVETKLKEKVKSIKQEMQNRTT